MKQEISRKPKVIIVDDVVTSGGHLAAMHGALTAARFNVADVAFAVGRTVYEKGDPLGTLVEECPRPMKAPPITPLF